MPVVLYRVDERLIHGQVVVGWGAVLSPDRIVVVDDELADSAWEQELYVMGLPPGLDTDFETVEHARAHLAEWREAAERTMVLTRDIATMRRLAEGGELASADINLGGIHYAPGRRAVLPYLFLSPGETTELRQLAGHVRRVDARDVPGSRAVELERLVEESG